MQSVSGGSMRRLLLEAVKGGGENAVQEVAQTIAENLIASRLVAYDPERELFTGLGEAAGVNFSAGALLSALAGLHGLDVRRLRGSETSRYAPPVEDEIPNLYNLPDKPQRPFEADYPRGASFDESGRLKTDIEGRELRGLFVVGRVARGPEEALPSPKESFDAIAEKVTGRATEVGAIKDWGQTSITEATGKPVGVVLSNRLTGDNVEKVYGHEIGHVIDQAVGEIPINGLHRELRRLYSFLNTGEDRPADNLFGPEHRGYSYPDVDRELIVEAIRAYMDNPNALKTLAPNTARIIRKYVNEHPEIGRIIQFNSIGAAGVIAASGAATDEEAKEE